MQESGIYSNFGPLCREFQARVAAEIFEGHGVVTAVANATLGLTIALAVFARPTGRYVVMPSFTFAATPQAARAAGFEPYFVDISATEWSLQIEDVRRVVGELGDEVAAVMPYATFGNPIDLSGYAELHDSGVPVVVDAASSVGSRTAEPFGRGFPGAVVFSLHATKAFGVGEGGLVYTADEASRAALMSAANFGFAEDRMATGWGTNAKLSELACAVGLAVLDEFPDRVALRSDLHESYLSALAERGGSALGVTTQALRGTVAHQFMPALLPEGLDSAPVIRHLASAGIEARTYFAPACHQQPWFAGCPREGLPVTESIAQRIVSLPLWEGMEDVHVERVVDTLVEASR